MGAPRPETETETETQTQFAAMFKECADREIIYKKSEENPVAIKLAINTQQLQLWQAEKLLRAT